MHDYVKTLGTVIRKAREEQGLSQAALAEKLGIDVRTIINIENFRGNPKFEVLYPLVTTLRIPADRIFYPVSEMSDDYKQQLLWELQNCSNLEAQSLLPIIRQLIKLIKGNSD
ncbi:MAG: helix-turn-helix domain-containing protein [Clostridium sp.]|nr:helix-turn-helix domain-containing protein [Clostridium sp.]